VARRCAGVRPRRGGGTAAAPHPRPRARHPARAGVPRGAAGRGRTAPLAADRAVGAGRGAPGLSWSGEGYLDSNEGDEPLEANLRRWHWSRAPLRDGSTVLYDVEARDGARTALALRFDRGGAATAFEPPPMAELPPSPVWRIARASCSQQGAPRVARTPLVQAMLPFRMPRRAR